MIRRGATFVGSLLIPVRSRFHTKENCLVSARII